VKKAEEALRKLIGKLGDDGILPPSFPAELAWDDEAEKMHGASFRFFCWTEQRNHVIHCARDLEKLPYVFMLGVLLHEAGHIHLQAFGGNPDEVRVDVWCKEVDPEYRFSGIEMCGEEEAGTDFLQRTGDSFAEEVRRWG
jgi:hypothetical protein